MSIFICASPAEAAAIASREILSLLRRKPDLVLGLATGSTPIEVYSRLIQARRDEGADFSRVRTFNLDEYLGLPADHPQSYRRFMREHLFAGLDLPAASIHFPPTEGLGIARQCEEFEQKIRSAGGIDLQILGIGSNGHIGFNEPTSSLRSRTRVVTLTQKTLEDNSRFYRPGEFQPRLAATMGIGTILGARRIILQAFGARKGDAVRMAVEGPVSAICPASALQLHPDSLILLDEEAASRLSLREYYRQARSNEEELRRDGRW